MGPQGPGLDPPRPCRPLKNEDFSRIDIVTNESDPVCSLAGPARVVEA
jgi:hypothetical protein